MPRTVESIVASHEAARALRARGKPIWDVIVPIGAIALARDQMGDDLTPEQAFSIATQLGQALLPRIPSAWREAGHRKFSYDFEDLAMVFEGLTLSDFVDTEDDPGDVLDGIMEQMYDWADGARVWIDTSRPKQVEDAVDTDHSDGVSTLESPRG